MKTLTRFAVVSLVFLVPSAARADDKADLEKMQGDWKTITAKRGGKDAPPEIVNSKMNVMKNTFTLISMRNGKERKDPVDVKLDSSKSPKQIDFIGKDGKINNHGIYKLEGKTMTLCFARMRDPRPTEFSSKEGSKNILLVLERPKK